MAGASSGPELTVRSESIQQLYRWYLTDRFRVNRRYQRKLVWSVEEKQKLIDSVLKDLPIPLFLVAEVEVEGDIHYELIDGMQRLNAIFSFLENEFPVGDDHFDLDALADTKQLKDAEKLHQRALILGRDVAVNLANYNIALSVFRSRSGESVDEVFRRINSGGRRLSRQELRQAGTISELADLVRVISSRIRGDTSPGDIVALQTMPELSITNRDLDYGVVVDDIFWVKQGVLRRADVRQSIDEQLVLDLLIDCLIDPIPSSGPDVRDAYYDYSKDLGEGARSPESVQIATAIGAYGEDNLQRDFMRVYDVIRRILSRTDERLTTLIGAGTSGRAPRYFHAIFMALYELMLKDRMIVKDYDAVVRGLRKIASAGTLSTPGGGGDWTSDDKRRAANAVKGNIRDAFEPAGEGEDFSQYGWASRLETTLSNALVEQQLFDCKQGFLRLDDVRSFDDASFAKICRTMTAMANAGRGRVGHVAVGIADSIKDAQRIRQLDGVEAVNYRRFHVVGIEREAKLRGESLNDYWNWLLQRIGGTTDLDPRIAASIRTESRLIQYHNGLVVGLLSVRAQDAPVFYAGELVDRRGSETETVPPGPDYAALYQRFLSA